MCNYCTLYKKEMKKHLNINNNRREGDLKSLPFLECQFESGRGHQKLFIFSVNFREVF